MQYQYWQKENPFLAYQLTLKPNEHSCTPSRADIQPKECVILLLLLSGLNQTKIM